MQDEMLLWHELLTEHREELLENRVPEALLQQLCANPYKKKKASPTHALATVFGGIVNTNRTIPMTKEKNLSFPYKLMADCKDNEHVQDLMLMLSHVSGRIVATHGVTITSWHMAWKDEDGGTLVDLDSDLQETLQRVRKAQDDGTRPDFTFHLQGRSSVRAPPSPRVPAEKRSRDEMEVNK